MTVDQILSLIFDKGFPAAVAIFVLVRLESAIHELHACVDALREEIRHSQRR